MNFSYIYFEDSLFSLSTPPSEMISRRLRYVKVGIRDNFTNLSYSCLISLDKRIMGLFYSNSFLFQHGGFRVQLEIIFSVRGYQKRILNSVFFVNSTASILIGFPQFVFFPSQIHRDFPKQLGRNSRTDGTENSTVDARSGSQTVSVWPRRPFRWFKSFLRSRTSITSSSFQR